MKNKIENNNALMGVLIIVGVILIFGLFSNLFRVPMGYGGYANGYGMMEMMYGGYGSGMMFFSWFTWILTIVIIIIGVYFLINYFGKKK